MRIHHHNTRRQRVRQSARTRRLRFQTLESRSLLAADFMDALPEYLEDSSHIQDFHYFTGDTFVSGYIIDIPAVTAPIANDAFFDDQGGYQVTSRPAAELITGDNAALRRDIQIVIYTFSPLRLDVESRSLSQPLSSPSEFASHPVTRAGNMQSELPGLNQFFSNARSDTESAVSHSSVGQTLNAQAVDEAVDRLGMSDWLGMGLRSRSERNEAVEIRNTASENDLQRKTMTLDDQVTDRDLFAPATLEGMLWLSTHDSQVDASTSEHLQIDLAQQSTGEEWMLGEFRVNAEQRARLQSRPVPRGSDRVTMSEGSAADDGLFALGRHGTRWLPEGMLSIDIQSPDRPVMQTMTATLDPLALVQLFVQAGETISDAAADGASSAVHNAVPAGQASDGNAAEAETGSGWLSWLRDSQVATLASVTFGFFLAATSRTRRADAELSRRNLRWDATN